MSDIDEMMKLYKEIQENYIKALERENEELRKQREKDSLKIEELEKRLLEERNNNFIKNIPRPTMPDPYDDKTVIGPGNGWGYPQNPVIWTTNKTTPVTYKYNTANVPTSIGTNVSISSDKVDALRQAYHDMTKASIGAKSMYDENEHIKIKQYQELLKKMQKEVEDDN